MNQDKSQTSTSMPTSNKDIYRLLKRCSKARDLTEWNEFRESTKNQEINFGFKNLSNLYLQNANFSNIDCRGANLRNTDFIGANVANSNIEQNLWYVVFITIAAIVATITYILINYFGLPINTIVSVVFGVSIIVMIVGIGVSAVVGGAIIGVGVAVGAVVGAGGAVVGAVVGAGIATIALVILFKIANQANQRAIASAFNPEKVIGFNLKYLSSKKTKLSEIYRKQIELSKETEEKASLTKQRDKILKKEKLAKTQEAKLDNIVREFTEPYSYIDKQIDVLEIHNYIFYGLIVISLFVVAVGFLSGYAEDRTTHFEDLFFQTNLPNFGTIFGLIIFYSTPVLLMIAILFYLIKVININLEKITNLHQKKQIIDVLISTLKAKIELGMETLVFQSEVTKLADIIQAKNIEMLNGVELKQKNEQTSKTT